MHDARVVQCSHKGLLFTALVVLELSTGEHLLIFLIAIGSFLGSSASLLLCLLSRLLSLSLLLVILGLLQADEIFTIDLVQLLLNVINDLVDARDHDELKSIHTSVGHLESLIKSHELCLQSRNRD